MPLNNQQLQMICLELLFAGHLYFNCIKKKNRRRRRTIGVRDIFKRRHALGDGFTLLEELRLNDPYMFFTYTRMNRERFEYLLNLVGRLIQKRDMYTAITPAQRLAMTLRFLAAGDSQRTLSFAFRCAQSTVSCILAETTGAIVQVLKPIFLLPPNTQVKWQRIANGFWKQWQFPHCLGAIDGKHIQIQAPQASQSVFFNYKKHFSIVLLAVCDADYNFTVVDIGAEGSQSDGGIFHSSELGRQLEEGSLDIPPPDHLPGSATMCPYFFVGDAAFPLKPYLMKPYGGRNVPNRSLIFNYRLSRARRVIENAFGILSARWRIFRQPISASLQTTEQIVEAAICLHNFIRKTGNPALVKEYCPSSLVDSEQPNGEICEGEWRDIVAGENGALAAGPRLGARNAAQQTFQQRDNLAEFCNGLGAVPWQNQAVRRRQGHN